MSLWIPMAGAVVLGMVFSQQPVINAAVARIVGSTIAASTVSVFITLCCLLALLPFAQGSVRPSTLVSLPWWSVLGGFIGVGIVAAGAAIVPLTGAALFFVCLVAGQLLGASVADHMGAFGLPEKSLTLTRLLGLLLVMGGAILVHRG